MSENTPHDDTPHDDRTEVVPPPPPPPAAEPVEPAQAAAPPPPPPPSGADGPGAGAVPPPPPGAGQQQYATPAPGTMTAAPLSPQEEKTWGMLSHVIGAVAMVASAGVLGFVGSLVIYLLYKDRGPFVRAHAANSLNIQITTAIAASSLSFVRSSFVLIGFLTLFLVRIWALVMHIIGAIKANNGEWWDPPLVPKFVR